MGANCGFSRRANQARTLPYGFQGRYCHYRGARPNNETPRNWREIFTVAWVDEERFPRPKQISVAAADDVIVIGYPRSFYDRAQLFPIVKLGVIASKWGSHFNGQPYFLIDAKLFPGSSGSLVISKPQDVAVISGQLKYSKEKNFAFLGVYSGEPFQSDQRPIELESMVITQKLGFNVGIVWYGNLVEEIIQNGQAYR